MTKIFVLSYTCTCFEMGLLFDAGEVGLSVQTLRLLHPSFGALSRLPDHCAPFVSLHIYAAVSCQCRLVQQVMP
jgi:hypothetical protein